MIRTSDERLTDVRAVVNAAARLTRDVDRIAPTIAKTSGLSVKGVRLAIQRHLEHGATEAELRALVADATETSRVLVILSSTVFTAALRAVAIARASAPIVRVQPSRRDPTFARELVATVDDARLTLAESGPGEPSATEAPGEIHVYGRDETIEAIRAGARAGTTVRGHGAGLGVACISSSATLPDAAKLVAEDVVPFDQRGCLSPRIALVEGTDERAGSFAEELHRALETAAGRVPRGIVTPAERSEAERYFASVAFAGRLWTADDHAVGFVPGALLLPPPGRHVHVVPFSEVNALAERLRPIGRFIVAFGTDDSARFAPAVPSWARVSPLGAMQRPPLDGPVDRRSR